MAIFLVYVRNFTQLEGAVESKSIFREHLGYKGCEFLLRTPSTDPNIKYDIILNFTKMEGFYPYRDHGDLLVCNAQVEVWRVGKDMQALSMLASLCPATSFIGNNVKMPSVFHLKKCSAVRIVYSWVTGTHSQFMLHYKFKSIQGRCKVTSSHY